jgi:exosome complex component RRP45
VVIAMNFFKSGIVASSHEPVFTRLALGQGLRIDGRLPHECRDVELSLYRGEASSSAEVQMGSTRVFCSVRGQIVAPFPDRPTEGKLQFGAHLSQGAEAAGLSHNEIVRFLERCIRESEAIDTESLCIVSGEKVWLVNCDVRVLDYAGNVLDAAVLAAMGALRAFRKPEISIAGKSSSSSGQIVIHSSDEREPLPLALHHTPLTVTIGIFKGIPKVVSSDSSSSSSSSSGGGVGFHTVLIGDPSISEERAMDGALVYGINTHSELCAVHKPGGVSVPIDIVMQAVRMASHRAETLHGVLQAALGILEQNVEADRRTRLEAVRAANTAIFSSAIEAAAAAAAAGAEMAVDEVSAEESSSGGGIDRDDPVLSWALLHRPAVSE